MSKKKYVIFPGYVRGHWISGHQLIQLYRLRYEDCVVFDGTPERLRGLDLSEFTCLGPRPDGRYTLPEDDEEPI